MSENVDADASSASDTAEEVGTHPLGLVVATSLHLQSSWKCNPCRMVNKNQLRHIKPTCIRIQPSSNLKNMSKTSMFLNGLPIKKISFFANNGA